MRMATPEMKVVRFNENDIIVASGDTLSLSKMGDGQAKNGVVNYKNQVFTLTDSSAVNAVMAALNAAGHDSSTEIRKPDSSPFKVEFILDKEVNSGIEDNKWNGNYLFIDGLFMKQ